MHEVFIADGDAVREIRIQTGFFGADGLSYLPDVLQRLAREQGLVEILVGSNDGVTTRSDVELLLTSTGPPRTNRRIGIVRFRTGYFHPKTVHLRRDDDTEAAYVGSANLTGSGVSALHVEAGLLLDSRDGDDLSVLREIAAAVDRWFETEVPGLTTIEDATELDALVEAGVLSVPSTLEPRANASRIALGSVRDGLQPLVALPRTVHLDPTVDRSRDDGSDRRFESRQGVSADVIAEVWSKPLSQSDAQRKPAGNQRGSITLVKGNYRRIDTQTYFRHDLFGTAEWATERTRTGEVRERAMIPFGVRFLGRDLGIVELEVSYAPNRESGQRNYTSLLHLCPLT